MANDDRDLAVAFRHAFDEFGDPISQQLRNITDALNQGAGRPAEGDPFLRLGAIMSTRPPKSFSGSFGESFPEWYEKFRKFMTLQGVSGAEDSYKIAFLESHFIGTALASLVDILKTHPGIIYDDLIEELNQAYPEGRDSDIYQGLIYDAKQKRTESVLEFVERLKKLAKAAYPEVASEIREKMLKPIFVRGLLPKIYEGLKYQEIDTFKDAIRKAIYTEQQVFRENVQEYPTAQEPKTNYNLTVLRSDDMYSDQIRSLVQAVQEALGDRRQLAGLSRRPEQQSRCSRCEVYHGNQRCPFETTEPPGPESTDSDASSTDYAALERANWARACFLEDYNRWQSETRFFRYENGRLYRFDGDSGLDSEGVAIDAHNSQNENSSDGLEQEFLAWLPAPANDLNVEFEDLERPINPIQPLNNLNRSESDDGNLSAIRTGRQRRRPRRRHHRNRRTRNLGHLAYIRRRRRESSSSGGNSSRPNTPIRCTCIYCPLHGRNCDQPTPTPIPPPAVIISSTPASPEPAEDGDVALNMWERYELISESSDRGQSDPVTDSESFENGPAPTEVSGSEPMAADD